MAYKNELRAYSLTPEQKASMIMILDQFSSEMETVHEIKNMLLDRGKFVVGSHYAVLLARIVAPYYPDWAIQLTAPLEKFPAHPPQEHDKIWKELVRRLS